MSGVVDLNGQQWEHCNVCEKFVKFPQDLGYEKPTEYHRLGRMLCVKCVDAGIRERVILFENVVPAPSWRTVEVAEA